MKAAASCDLSIRDGKKLMNGAFAVTGVYSALILIILMSMAGELFINVQFTKYDVRQCLEYVTC